MAILFGARRIYPVEALIGAMRDLTDMVGRVEAVGPSGPFVTSTAWYIAPRLVILPAFALKNTSPDPGTLRVVSAGGRGWTAKAAGPPEFLGDGLPLGLDYKGPTLAVLRTFEPAARVLPLGFDVQGVGSPVCLVHFPRGAPELCASFGQLQQADDTVLAYDADTEAGSSGAPILDSSWRVIGMHAATHFENKLNLGLPRSHLLQILQASHWWPEIAEHHKLADVAAAKAVLTSVAAAPQPSPLDPILIRAAISPDVDPKSLSKAERETLRGAVADDTAERWTLLPTERRRVIAAVGTIDALQPFRPRSRNKAAEPLQRVINRILDGPPYDLDQASEDELSWWIQAVRWFEPVAKDLPKPAEVVRTLERRRIRGRLARIAGPGFQGRKDDLAILSTWYGAGAGPLALTGIGGIGKSALVARFASKLPGDTLLLWLDFDRADLAPDDAVSVLTALFEQAALQVDGMDTPDLDTESWQDHALRLGERLAEKAGPNAPLLVLDSFEAAQYAERYQELWPVLEQLARGLPQLRVCVTGRAPVPGLKLAGKEAQACHLAGLKDEDVRGWLATRKITEDSVVAQVVEIARGIPLVLQLAFRLLENGGKLEDLPRDLPDHMIAGYLHDRILDRVQNPAFKPLATGLLVLRRLTLDMITPVLGGLVTFPPGEPSSWFTELSREMGLVIGGNVLVPRAEVRSATLWLLERDKRAMVREANERAAAWYAREGATTPEDAAELVYHRLRLNDIAGAASAWRDGCGAFLTYATDDIRDPAARAWLQQRLGAVVAEQRPLDLWEQDAAERIRAARGRGIDRIVGEILKERPERSQQSPLYFHDAYELYVSGHGDKAVDVLDRYDPFAVGTGPIGRECNLLRALLAADAGDRRTADLLLSHLDDSIFWSDRPTAEMDALAVIAARINLTVDLDGEAKLLGRLHEHWQDVKRVLAPADVVTPMLRDRLRGSGTGLESAPDAVSLGPDFDGNRLLDAVEQDRRLSVRNEPTTMRDWRTKLFGEWASSSTWTESPPFDAYSMLGPNEGRNIAELAERGWRRWWLAAHGRFLQPAFQLCTRGSAAPSPLAPSILGTLALFAAPLDTAVLGGPDLPLPEALRKSPLGRGPIHVRRDTWPRIQQVLTSTVDPEMKWDNFIKREQDDYLVFWGEDLLNYRLPNQRSAAYGSFLLFLFAPDPLRKLVEDLAGVQPPPQLT